jgi:hypothetical protein
MAAGVAIDFAGEELGGQVPTSALDSFALGRGSGGLGLAAASLGSGATRLGTDGASTQANMRYVLLPIVLQCTNASSFQFSLLTYGLHGFLF